MLLWCIILIASFVGSGVCYAQVYSPPTQQAPLLLTASDIYGNAQPGTSVIYRGWVVGAGGNRYGRWIDVLDLSEYGSRKPRSVRVYHTFLTTIAKDEFVDIRGYLPLTGERSIRADSITISYLPKPRL